MQNKTKWTKPQQDAISGRGGSLLVSAGAGSGKTAVLTERCVQLIFDPINPIDADKLLVMTYTKAAAAEMKERIASKIRSMQEEAVTHTQKSQLQRQLILLERAGISTVDSFCQTIIKENFQQIGIEPQFRIADEAELQIWKNEAATAVIEAAYSEHEPMFLELVELLSIGRDDSALIKTVIKVYDFARANPFYENWAMGKLHLYSNSESQSDSIWGKIIWSSAEELLLFAGQKIQAAVTAMEQDTVLTTAYGDCIYWYKKYMGELRELILERNWDGAEDKLANGFVPPPLGKLTKYEDLERKGFVTAGRDICKATAEQLRDKYFCCTSSEYAEDMTDLYPKIEKLYELVAELDKKFTELKKERSAVDFSDVEHLALKLLVEPKIKDGITIYQKTPAAERISKRFAYVFIDEYQDTNDVQDMIFSAVSDEGKNLFMVGDVKQSIYKFRQAKPEIFLAKKKSYLPYGSGFPSQINLSTNFRSREQVVSAVNYLFEQLMSDAVGDIDYRDGEQLLAGASYPPTSEPCCEVHIVDSRESDTELSSIEQEAAYVAGLIEKLLASGRLIKQGDTQRKIMAKDICILLRAPKKKAKIYADALMARKIGSTAEMQTNFLQSREISQVLSLLKVVDNPLLDVDMAAAMMSPIFAFSPDEMVQIRLENRRQSLYACVLAHSERDSHCKEFVSLMSELRFTAAGGSVGDVITEIYDKTGLEAVMRMSENGDKCLQNLRLLIQYAWDFEGRGYAGLTGFLRLVDRMKESGGDFTESGTVSGTGDSVTILSIHKSKGLEFPVVIVADCAKGYNEMDLNQGTLLHGELGFACMRRDKKGLRQYTTVPLEAMRCKIRSENRSEEMRMLYVAATRAKELLIFVGTCADISKKLAELSIEPEDGRVPIYAAASRKSYMDLLLQALLLHPDGYELRAVAGKDCKSYSEAIGSFKVVIGKYSSEEAMSEENAVSANIDRELLTALRARQSFTYAYPQAVNLPTKLAISHISELGEENRYRFKSRPTFLYSKGMTAAERGNALHKFMQFCSYSAAKADPAAEIARLVAGEFITKEEGESIETKKLEEFFRSTLADRIFAAEAVHREYRFLALAGEEILGKYSPLDFAGNKTTVQGVADCIFVEKDGAVVLDYKTDFVHTPTELLDKYSTQLSLYGILLGEALDKKVKQCIIYSFALGTQIEVPIK